MRNQIMSKVYKMLSDNENHYGIAFGGSDDSSSSSSSSSSSYRRIEAADRNIPKGAYQRGPDRTATQARIENNPGRVYNPTKDCSRKVGVAVATIATNSVAISKVKSALDVGKNIVKGGSMAYLTNNNVVDAINECTSPKTPGIVTKKRK